MSSTSYYYVEEVNDNYTRNVGETSFGYPSGFNLATGTGSLSPISNFNGNFNSYAMHMADANAPYLEFTIPFQSLNNKLSISGRANKSDYDSLMGYLYVFYQSADMRAADAVVPDPAYIILFAADDDFCIMNWIGVPSVQRARDTTAVLGLDKPGP